ncbi:MAG: hypothetical protein KA985_03005 [Selenomonas sp.]|nr:hypothetical protein [Selenomonas sp.]
MIESYLKKRGHVYSLWRGMRRLLRLLLLRLRLLLAAASCARSLSTVGKG